MIYYDFSKIQLKYIEKENTNRCHCNKTIVTVANPPSKTV